MENYLFLSILWMIVAMGIMVTYQWLKRKRWRYALFYGVVTLMTAMETVLFLQERDCLEQTEYAYFLAQLGLQDLGAYLILILNLFLLGMSLYTLLSLFRRKEQR